MFEKLFDMSGKVAVVTGASANGGIGHAIVLGLAAFGADVAICDIDESGMQTTAQEIQALGRRVFSRRCDISKPEEVEAFFNDADQHFDHLNILVNVPFAFPSRVRPHELTLDNLQKTLSVSLIGYFLCSQHALRRMLAKEQKGCILNIGSIAGVSGMGRGNFPYSIAKGGVAQMTRELAVEYAQQGIRANAILPCQVRTPGLQKQLDADPTFAERVLPRFLAGIPIGRLLEAEDFVGAAVFLCSDAASAVTGVLLPVDGGNLAMNAGGSFIWPKD